MHTLPARMGAASQQWKSAEAVAQDLLDVCSQAMLAHPLLLPFPLLATVLAAKVYHRDLVREQECSSCALVHASQVLKPSQT